LKLFENVTGVQFFEPQCRAKAGICAGFVVWTICQSVCSYWTRRKWAVGSFMLWSMA